MGLLGKLFKKKEVKKGTANDSKVTLPETPEQKQAKQFENYIKTLTETAKQRYGYDEARASKWAWQQVNDKMEKQRMKGTPVSCTVCKKSGVNSQTGPFVKTADGKGYVHQNCKG